MLLLTDNAIGNPRGWMETYTMINGVSVPANNI